MIEIYEKEINELIKDISRTLNTQTDAEHFSRLCWLMYGK